MKSICEYIMFMEIYLGNLNSSGQFHTIRWIDLLFSCKIFVRFRTSFSAAVHVLKSLIIDKICCNDLSVNIL